ncbi:uncharacterized protein FIESC28_07287 [Fusarium coffeatum]|uniref:Uncharacterized protein n=1 Tax=Fusarium coffeatum TaxID=231269 RepID=A0A366RGW5_9HYPO|nr:uncharacterized protein FIESC28_07287 [Fusarium coffeatum]RBR15646.1 hypothetical protein FIESC28_07287 [Fusarium coffeatum]
MPALPRPPPWNSLAEKVRALIAEQLPPAPISIAEEIPSLIARQLSDNDTTLHNNPLITTLASKGTPLYKSRKFWAIGGVLLAIIIIGAVCAGGASGKGDSSQEADYSDSGSEGKLSAWRHKKKQEARKREVDLATWEAYERARENETEAKLEAVQDTTRNEIPLELGIQLSFQFATKNYLEATQGKVRPAPNPVDKSIKGHPPAHNSSPYSTPKNLIKLLGWQKTIHQEHHTPSNARSLQLAYWHLGYFTLLLQVFLHLPIYYLTLNTQSRTHHLYPSTRPSSRESPTMLALANYSPWVSVAKKIPALVARQLRDNESSTISLLSSGNAWYRSKKFWIIIGIILGIALIVDIGLCAGSHSERRQAEPPKLMAAWEAEEAERQESSRKWQTENDRREAETAARIKKLELEHEEYHKLKKKKDLEKEFKEDQKKAMRKARVKKMMENRENLRFSE